MPGYWDHQRGVASACPKQIVQRFYSVPTLLVNSHVEIQLELFEL